MGAAASSNRIDAENHLSSRATVRETARGSQLIREASALGRPRFSLLQYGLFSISISGLSAVDIPVNIHTLLPKE